LDISIKNTTAMEKLKTKLLSTVIVFLITMAGIFAQNLENKQDIYYKEGKVFTGKHSTYFASGQLESERNFVMGVEDGLSVWYFEDGQLREQRAWRNGKKHGTWTKYNPARIKTAEEANCKLGVIEADVLLDDVLKKMGYSGETMSERIERITQVQLKTISELREAHSVRNNILHNPNFKLTSKRAEEVIELYEKVLKEIDIM